MKKTFPEYYELPSSKKKKIMDEGIFVFDANVLLDLYRYSPDTRKKWLAFFEKVKDRIWIPHQFAFEYQKNRLAVIADQESAYEEVFKILAKTSNSLDSEFAKYKRHPFLRIEDLTKESFEKMKKEVEKCKKKHPAWFKKDNIRTTISNLFKNKVGSIYDEGRLIEIFKEGAQRYAKKTPPGYKDTDKDNPYGDLIGWFQIIDEAKKRKNHVIFITGDEKEDWWLEVKGKKVGPRYELIREFQVKTSTSKEFLMYRMDRFLKEFASDIGAEVLEEVKQIAKEKTIEANLAFPTHGSDVGLSMPIVQNNEIVGENNPKI